MSSKKAKRKEAYLEREKKRAKKKETDEKFRKALDSGDIKEMVSLMGIKLR